MASRLWLHRAGPGGTELAQGRRKLEKEVRELLAGEAVGLSDRIRVLVAELLEEWTQLDERIGAFDSEFVMLARTDATARRLATVPGIGPINATALVAAVGHASAFAKGRDMAAWLGLVPRQATTGGRPRLLGISKRGNRYVRKNLVHGARAALLRLATRDTPECASCKLAQSKTALRPARSLSFTVFGDSTLPVFHEGVVSR